MVNDTIEKEEKKNEKKVKNEKKKLPKENHLQKQNYREDLELADLFYFFGKGG